jgi:hypothetical protein
MSSAPSWDPGTLHGQFLLTVSFCGGLALVGFAAQRAADGAADGGFATALVFGVLLLGRPLIEARAACRRDNPRCCDSFVFLCVEPCLDAVPGARWCAARLLGSGRAPRAGAELHDHESDPGGADAALPESSHLDVELELGADESEGAQEEPESPRGAGDAGAARSPRGGAPAAGSGAVKDWR